MSNPRILTYDVGWNYRLSDPPTHVTLASLATNARDWPPDNMLSLGAHAKGVWGTLQSDHPKLVQYQRDAINLVKKNIQDHALVVLPEFSGSPFIENEIKTILDKSNKRCIVVAGSYYRSAVGAKERVESVSPILIPHVAPFYQNKFHPSPIERPGFDSVDNQSIFVFRNTGFGDFAVLVCSDTLDTDANKIYIEALRHHIDFLVVPSRNRAPRLETELQKLADEERWNILYCNGQKTASSRIISPYKTARAPKLGRNHSANFDLVQFQHDLVRETDLHQRADRRIFPPGPRWHPFRGPRAIGFSDHLRVVAIGSHFDDVWLGCSASLMRLQECCKATVCVLTMCKVYPTDYFGRYKLQGTALENLEEDLDSLCTQLDFHHERPPEEYIFQDGFFKEDAARTYLRDFVSRVCHTDILFVPRHDDQHGDHAVTAKAAVTEFRGANVLEYEIKDFRRSPFDPNVLIDVSMRSNRPLKLHGVVEPQGLTFAEKKAFVLENAFRIINKDDLPPAFQNDIARMTFRASQSGLELRYAEAFASEMII